MYLEPNKEPLHGRVLVVDDTPDARVVLAKILRRFGLEVETADDGLQAHDQAMAALEAGEPFDIILMDMQMPVMDGLSATLLLREHHYHGTIVALTGMGAAREQCLRSGCDDFINKPVAFDLLLQIVLSHLISPNPCEPLLPG